MSSPRTSACCTVGNSRSRSFWVPRSVKISLETARALQAFGPDVEYVQMDGNGTNALDFHIAYYIGRLAAEYPDAYFHIISKDTGFDPLIKTPQGP
jgi:hypothetical protein